MTILLEPHLSVTGDIGVFRSDFNDRHHELHIFHGPCSSLIEQVSGSGAAMCEHCGQKWYRSYLPVWDLRKSVNAKEIKHWVACWTELHPIEIQVVIGD